MRIKLLAVMFPVLFFLVMAGSQRVACAESGSALDSVKQTIDQVIKVNESYPGESHLAERREKLKEVIRPRFDFDEMAKRSLGASWNDITPEQRGEFTQLFSELLERTYLNRVENVNEKTVKVDSEQLDFPRSVVKTTVESKGDKFPIDYRLMNRSGQWKVYDVIIENIGLVANYRNEFAGIMRRDKFDGLMQKLREKIG